MRGQLNTIDRLEESRPMRSQNPRMSPDWGETETPNQPQQPQQPQPSQSPVHHPHAPVEVPPEATPPMPEHLPIGDPKQGRRDLSAMWPRPGCYF